MNQNEILLKSALESFVRLGQEEWTAFYEGIQYATYQKHEIILSEGRVEHFIYFVLSGCIKASVFSKGKEITLDFALKNDLISSYVSFLTDTPAKTALEALEPTSVIRIPKQHIFRLYDKYKQAEQMGRKVSEWLYIQKAEREQDFLMLTATERYLKLLKKDADLVKNIPLKYLASYLGIHPESLSRIRKEIT